MSSHGNPTLRLPGAAVAGQVVTVADCAGSEVWHSHPLAAGRDAVCVDVRDGRFVGVGGGWSVLPPGGYTVATPAAAATDARPLAPPPSRRAVAPAGGRIEVAAELRVTARFGAAEGGWLPRDAAWHSDGTWRLQGGTDPGIVAVAVEAAAGTRPAGPPGGGSRGACAYLFVDAAMHGAVGARFTAPGAGSAAVWGLIARHYNDGNHLRLTLQRDGAGLLLRLERRAAAADPGCRRRILAAAHVTLGGAPRGELRWHFNGTRHEVALDGVVRLTAADGYMGGVEIVGLFAEPDLAGSAPVWHSFSVVSSQWVPRHAVRRGAYAAVVRPGNIHRLHLSPAPGRQPATLDPRTNLFWESGLQVGHIGGSEIKFTQGAALDLLARGPVADLVRWRGPMPRFVDQDADLRGYARGSAVFYDDRIVVGDWVAVRVRRSVGPDFDLLARALTGPARFAAGAERTFRPWKLPAGAATATLAAGPCRELYPVALAFPLRIGSAAWHLIAAVGGLCNVGGAAPGRAFGWRCPRRLTASHDLRVAPTVPGTEYGFWIACTWLFTADTAAAEAAALHLRDEFRQPAHLSPHRGTLVRSDATQEQPAARLALAGCFDRSSGAYRLQAEAGAACFTFDPGAIRRHRPVFLVDGLAAAAPAAVACIADGRRLRSGTDYRWQAWPTGADAVLVQLRRDVTAPLTLELRRSASDAIRP